MSEYLKNLQESVILTESFNRVKENVAVTEDELLGELQDIFSEEELKERSTPWDVVGNATPWDHIPTSGGGGAATLAIAAAAIAAGVLAYKKIFSKAAKACDGDSDCMAKYKMKANQAKIAAISAGKSKCAKSKDPAKCKAKLDQKIAATKK